MPKIKIPCKHESLFQKNVTHLRFASTLFGTVWSCDSLWSLFWVSFTPKHRLTLRSGSLYPGPNSSPMQHVWAKLLRSLEATSKFSFCIEFSCQMGVKNHGHLLRFSVLSIHLRVLSSVLLQALSLWLVRDMGLYPRSQVETCLCD